LSFSESGEQFEHSLTEARIDRRVSIVAEQPGATGNCVEENHINNFDKTLLSEKNGKTRLTLPAHETNPVVQVDHLEFLMVHREFHKSLIKRS